MTRTEIVPFESDVICHLLETEQGMVLPQPPTLEADPTRKHWSEKCIDFIFTISEDHKFLNKTLILCLYLFRRFEYVFGTSPTALSRLAATSMMIAMKFEEIYPPCIDEISRDAK